MIRQTINSWRWSAHQAGSSYLDLKDSLQWLMLARLAVVYFLCSAVIVQSVLHAESLSTSQLRLAYSLFAVVFSWNLLWALGVHRLSFRWIYADLQIAFDVLVVSVWIFFSGESGVLFALFYLIEILVVALFFFQRGAWFAALLSCVMFGMVVVLQPAGNTTGLSLWGGFSIIFILVALIGGFLSEELSRTAVSLKENQKKMVRLSALHEKILANMPTGLLTVDSELKVGFINPAGEQILGKANQDVAGRYLAEVEPRLLPFFSSIDSETIVEGVDDRSPGYRIETAVSGEHHRTYFVQADAALGHRRLQQTVEVGSDLTKKVWRGDSAALEPEEGSGDLAEGQRAGGRVLLFQDVTKLSQLEDKLRQNEKLAVVGQLAAGIAHEIRNPLAGISASIEMLRQDLPSQLVDPENKKLMDIAIREIDRLNQLISEFLNYVKPDQVKFESVNLSDLLGDVVVTAMKAKDFGERFKVIKQWDAALYASASSEKIKQVIWNLFNNAAQSMNKGGEIIVGCGPVDDRRVSLWVEDHGTGMSDEVLQHLYEPFFTTKDKGTGLGLATVYRIIESHHGEIKVTSKVGAGTRFEVYLLRG